MIHVQQNKFVMLQLQFMLYMIITLIGLSLVNVMTGVGCYALGGTYSTSNKSCRGISVLNFGQQ